jgi:hypothetical protein
MHTATILQAEDLRDGAFTLFRHAPPPSAHSSPEVHHARRTPVLNREGDGPGSFSVGV